MGDWPAATVPTAAGAGDSAEAAGFTGLLHGDTRMLSRAEVRVNGQEPDRAAVEAEAGGVLRVRGWSAASRGPPRTPPSSFSRPGR